MVPKNLIIFLVLLWAMHHYRAKRIIKTKYRETKDIVASYYLDSQIKDDFQCNHDCYSQHRDPTIYNYSNTCTHEYHHITQSIQDLSDSTQ